MALGKFSMPDPKNVNFFSQTTDETDSAKSASSNFSLSTVMWVFMIIEIENLKEVVTIPYRLY